LSSLSEHFVVAVDQCASKVRTLTAFNLLIQSSQVVASELHQHHQQQEVPHDALVNEPAATNFLHDVVLWIVPLRQFLNMAQT